MGCACLRHTHSLNQSLADQSRRGFVDRGPLAAGGRYRPRAHRSKDDIAAQRVQRAQLVRAAGFFRSLDSSTRGATRRNSSAGPTPSLPRGETAWPPGQRRASARPSFRNSATFTDTPPACAWRGSPTRHHESPRARPASLPRPRPHRRSRRTPRSRGASPDLHHVLMFSYYRL